MISDWTEIDRRLMGDAWIGSAIWRHVSLLCDEIGVRWAGTPEERRAAQYAAEQWQTNSLDAVQLEDFELQSWRCRGDSLILDGPTPTPLDARACLFCPPVEMTARLVDVGFGMPHDLSALPPGSLSGAVALLDAGLEPFSEPVPLSLRLRSLAAMGVRAVVTIASPGGRRTADFSVTDWRDGTPWNVPLPVIQTSREDGARLRRRVHDEVTLTVRVDAERLTGRSWNAVGDLTGIRWPEESLILGAHHDTTTDSCGANDNAAGVAVLLETARLLATLRDQSGINPGRSIRFVSFGAEEQGLQGSTAFVARHYGPEPTPRLMINLDELATGNMKGVVLQFPELRSLVQTQLDSMGEGLACHVLAQLDASGDMFPFARAGIASSILWRWRFVGRHPDTAFGHTTADTPDKLRVRELKEYAGYLSRLLLRLSHVPPDEWPENRLGVEDIRKRLEVERTVVFRTM